MKTITIDDLQAEILRRAKQAGAGEYFSAAAENQLEMLNVWVQEHRPALEAGMRRPLRFKVLNWYGENTYKPIIADIPRFGFHSEEECVEFAKDLGLTAEFVGDVEATDG